MDDAAAGQAIETSGDDGYSKIVPASLAAMNDDNHYAEVGAQRESNIRMLGQFELERRKNNSWGGVRTNAVLTLKSVLSVGNIREVAARMRKTGEVNRFVAGLAVSHGQQKIDPAQYPHVGLVGGIDWISIIDRVLKLNEIDGGDTLNRIFDSRINDDNDKLELAAAREKIREFLNDAERRGSKTEREKFANEVISGVVRILYAKYADGLRKAADDRPEIAEKAGAYAAQYVQNYGPDNLTAAQLTFIQIAGLLHVSDIAKSVEGKQFMPYFGACQPANDAAADNIIWFIKNIAPGLHVDIRQLGSEQAIALLDRLESDIKAGVKKGQISPESKIMIVCNMDDAVIRRIKSFTGFEAYVELGLENKLNNGANLDSIEIAAKNEIKKIKDSGASVSIDTSRVRASLKEAGLSDVLAEAALKHIAGVASISGAETVVFEMGSVAENGDVEAVPSFDSEKFSIIGLLSAVSRGIGISRVTTVDGLFREGRSAGRAAAAVMNEAARSALQRRLFARHEDGWTPAAIALIDSADDAINLAGDKFNALKVAENIRKIAREMGMENEYMIGESLKEIEEATDINVAKAYVARIKGVVQGLAVTVLAANSGVDVKSEKISARRQEALENGLLARSRDIVYTNGKPYLKLELNLEQRLGILSGALRLLNESDKAMLLDNMYKEMNEYRDDEQRLYKLMFVEAVFKAKDRELWRRWKSKFGKDYIDGISQHATKWSAEQELKMMAYWANYLKIMEPQREKNEINRLIGALSTRMGSLPGASTEAEIIAKDVTTKEGLAFLILSLSLGELLDREAIKTLAAKANLGDSGLAEKVFAGNHNPYAERAHGRLNAPTAEDVEIWLNLVALEGANLFALSKDKARARDEFISFAILELCNGLPPMIDGKTLEEKVKRAGKISVKNFRGVLISG